MMESCSNTMIYLAIELLVDLPIQGQFIYKLDLFADLLRAFYAPS
jgi:hypothetical protein